MAVPWRENGTDLLALFAERKAAGDVVRICAPMVRYSKLAFRLAVRRHGTDVAYTPMMVAESFVTSARARDMDFQTNADDRCACPALPGVAFWARGGRLACG